MEAGDWLRPLAEGKEEMYFWSEQKKILISLKL